MTGLPMAYSRRSTDPSPTSPLAEYGAIFRYLEDGPLMPVTDATFTRGRRLLQRLANPNRS